MTDPSPVVALLLVNEERERITVWLRNRAKVIRSEAFLEPGTEITTKYYGAIAAARALEEAARDIEAEESSG